MSVQQEAIEKALLRARAELPPHAFGAGEIANLSAFNEFIAVGETGLALLSIASMAEHSSASSTCWDEIFEAARLMGVPLENRTPERLEDWDGFP